MSERYRGKTVLVVGGNSGIGLACARGFADEGATVIVSGRNADTLEQTVESIGNNCSAIQADIVSMDGIDSLVDEVKVLTSKLDVIFISAGIGKVASLEDMTEEIWDESINVNLKASFFIVQKLKSLLVKGSSVLLTSSVAWLMGPPDAFSYSAGKAGVRSLARTLAGAMVGEGIRVNCVSPGPIDTPLVHRDGGFANLSPDQALEMMRNLVPMKRVAAPEEMVGPVLFLCSDEASFITGVDLLVDGGMMSL